VRTERGSVAYSAGSSRIDAGISERDQCDFLNIANPDPNYYGTLDPDPIYYETLDPDPK
jgi:hypothetical protein